MKTQLSERALMYFNILGRRYVFDESYGCNGNFLKIRTVKSFGYIAIVVDTKYHQ